MPQELAAPQGGVSGRATVCAEVGDNLVQCVAIAGGSVGFKNSPVFANLLEVHGNQGSTGA